MRIYNYLLSALIILSSACGGDTGNGHDNIDYKQKMREFIEGISRYAKSYDNDFIIIPQNGPELATTDGNEDGEPATEYLDSIDGAGREDLFYGYDNDNEATPSEETEYMVKFCDIFKQGGVEVLTIDYCRDHSLLDDSYARNYNKGYISFGAPARELNIIPDYPSAPYNENSSNIASLADAKNFLYLINPENFSTKQSFINAVNATNYDVIIMDLFLNDAEFTPSEITQLKIKNNGGVRLVISYMSIGEAEDYRYYWDDLWKTGSPSWLRKENPDWEGNYKIEYWNKDWQDIIYGNDSSYLKKIIDAGFDGAYLDIIDAFEYFEN